MNSPFNCLNSDMWIEKIFPHLSIDDVIRCKSVCKGLHTVINSKKCIKRFEKNVPIDMPRDEKWTQVYWVWMNTAPLVIALDVSASMVRYKKTVLNKLKQIVEYRKETIKTRGVFCVAFGSETVGTICEKVEEVVFCMKQLKKIVNKIPTRFTSLFKFIASHNRTFQGLGLPPMKIHVISDLEFGFEDNYLQSLKDLNYTHPYKIKFSFIEVRGNKTFIDRIELENFDFGSFPVKKRKTDAGEEGHFLPSKITFEKIELE